ncbi:MULTISPECIES: hypothetical protein [unclassified Mesorhizobium]|uniref:hypothetical protein n=1 Tax=unclassified Mesorhizobium TaxID=325217 RepID=UPI001140FF27|nr:MULTISPECIES: hypothetical protein [unclassified Mesorhizobium]
MEIAGAFSTGPEMMLLDGPTPNIAPGETAKLSSVLKREASVMRVENQTAAGTMSGSKQSTAFYAQRFSELTTHLRSLSGLARPLLVEMRQQWVRTSRMRTRKTSAGHRTGFFHFSEENRLVRNARKV